MATQQAELPLADTTPDGIPAPIKAYSQADAQTLEAAIESYSPLSILDKYVSRPELADVVVLERLTALVQTEEAAVAKRKWVLAMNACQAEMPTIVRNADNKQTNSRYAKLETIAMAIKPVYLRHGFAPNYGEIECQVEKHIRVFLDLDHVDGHSKRFLRTLALDDVGIKGTANKTEVHASASSFTYACRYLLTGAFNITIADTDVYGQQSRLKLSKDQMREINTMLDELERLGKPCALNGTAGFFQWLGIEGFEEAPATMFDKIMGELRYKLKKASGK